MVDRLNEDWSDLLWERPAPDPERVARHELHEADEPSKYVRRTAHLPGLVAELVESDAFDMRLLRRASSGR